jgi:hypothetical protein
MLYMRHIQEIMGKLTKYCREKALQSGLSRRDATSIHSLVRKGAFHCIHNKSYICAKRLKIKLSSLLPCLGNIMQMIKHSLDFQF